MSESSFTNIQVLCKDADAVRLAIEVCDIGSSKMMGRVDSNWTSIYPYLTEDDYAYLKIIATKLSNRLSTSVIGFYAPNSEVMRYVICRNDEVIDEYYSNPGYPDAQEPASGGDASLLLPLCVRGTKSRDLLKLLHPQADEIAKNNLGDRILQRLAQYLGIARADLCTGYNHLKWAQAGR